MIKYLILLLFLYTVSACGYNPMIPTQTVLLYKTFKWGGPAGKPTPKFDMVNDAESYLYRPTSPKKKE